MLLLSSISCYGMRKKTEELAQTAEDFNNNAHTLLIQAQQRDVQMDWWCNTLTLGLYGAYFKDASNQQSPTTTQPPQGHVRHGHPSKAGDEAVQAWYAVQQHQAHQQRNNRTTQIPDPQDRGAHLDDEIVKDLLQAAQYDEERRAEKLDMIIAHSEDLLASPKEFLWQARKQHFSLWDTIDYKTVRSLLTITSFSTLLYLGIQNLFPRHGNKKFGLFATLIGISGSACMAYDFVS